MALQVFFGDDEHTAKDGTYSRILRARKWLYLSAAVATILALGLYDPESAATALRVVSLPEWLLSQAITAGLAYLLIQYGLLLFQLLVTYDLVLSERLAFRRADELSAATDRLSRSRQELGTAESRFESDAKAAFGSLEQELTVTRGMERKALEELASPPNPLSGQMDELMTDLERRASIATKLRQTAEDKVEALSRQLAGQSPVPELESLKQAVSEAEVALEHLRRQNPADRPGYALAERLIDAARVVPPSIVAAIALVALLRSMLSVP